MDEQQILENVEMLTAEQLSEYISCGIVTLKNLQDTGLLTVNKRKAILKLQILKKAKDLTAEQLSEYIKKGIVTIEELQGAGSEMVK
jgi:hypothetical protein